MKIGSKVLGLAIGQKSILLAEVAPRSGRNAVQQFAEFVYPEGLSLATPEKLGEALGQFIKARRFSTRDAVIGLPAKRLVTRQKEVPPAKPEVVASALRLQAEGEFSAEMDRIVLDYAGTPSTSETTKVLLMATNREVIEQCETLASSAGLRVHGITATSAALGRATSRLPGGDGWVLNLGPNGAEIVVQHGQDPAHLRHLNVGGSNTPESIAALAGEIRRVMASVPRNGTPMTLAVWRGPSPNEEMNTGNLLEQRLSMPVNTPELRTLVTSDNPEAEGFAPAVAVALSALEPAGLPVDFLHSRLTPPAPPKVSTEKKLMIIGAVLLLLTIGGAYYHLDTKRSEVARLDASIAKQKDAVDTAKAEAKQLADVQGAITNGPNFIKVMRDVTRLFPSRSETIWVTRFEHSRDITSAAPAARGTTPAALAAAAAAKKKRARWTIDGKATSQAYVTQLRDAMVGNPKMFTNVTVSYRKETNANNGAIGFTIQFTYISE